MTINLCWLILIFTQFFFFFFSLKEGEFAWTLLKLAMQELTSANLFIMFSARSRRVQWTTVRMSPATWLHPVPLWFRTPCWRGDVPVLWLLQRKLKPYLVAFVPLQRIGHTLFPLRFFSILGIPCFSSVLLPVKSGTPYIPCSMSICIRHSSCPLCAASTQISDTLFSLYCFLMYLSLSIPLVLLLPGSG